MIKRRNFLHDCMHTTAFAVLPITVTVAAQQALSLEGELSKELFTALKNETFKVYGGEGLVEVTVLQLIDIRDSEHNNASSQIDQFSVVFRGANEVRLAKGVYFFEHASAGKSRLFIEPVGSDAQGSYFEADFNLLR